MNLEQLKTVVEKANSIFKGLQEKYPGLAGYLVFSSPYGQCDLTVNMDEILKAFPAMISDSHEKEKAIELLRTITELQKDKKKIGQVNDASSEKIEKIRSDLTQIRSGLEINEDIFVEIRFVPGKIDLSLIFQLQKEKTISREHTPQTKASIRIVIGRIGDLY